MPIGWIDRFYNNADQAFQMKAVDGSHLGTVTQILGDGNENFSFDDRDWHAFNPGRAWRGDWCGIPWYSSAPPFGHYRELSTGAPRSVMFFQSQMEGTNYVWFLQLQTGRQVVRIQVPKDADYHCIFRWENDGPYLDVLNDNGTTTEVVAQINDQARGWVTALGPIAAAAIAAAAA